MSRISNNSFAVNSSLEQKIDLATVSAGGIPITGTVNVDVVADSVGLASSVNQVTANSSLANIDTSLVNIDSNTSGLATELTASNISTDLSNLDSKILQGLDAQIPNTELGLQQVLCYGRDTSGNADALKTTSNGNLECEVSGPLGSNLSLDSVSVVIASDQSSVPVTFSSGTHSGSQANLMNAVSASNGTNSNVITTTSSNNINIFGVTTGTGDVKVQQSADNIVFYDVGYSLFPDMNGNFNANFSNHPSNYWRIQATETATITATLLHS